VSLPSLEGRTAVVTGASRGLGAGLARDFFGRGMRLGLFARSDPVLPSGERVVARRVDVRDAKAVEAFAVEVEERLGPIDLWINNAGVLEPIAPVRDVEPEAFREHVDVNLTGVFIGTRAYVRRLRATGRRGVLVNISSGAAWHGYAGWGAYCAAKAAVDNLTDCVRLEEESAGLRAYAVAPGVVDTDMQALIRDCTPDRFPAVERFRELEREDHFNTPSFVARHLLAIAFDPDWKPADLGAAPDTVSLRLPDEKQ
jgi:NAD(P)-dependent dehydrogenase (short-subunit alcohol dehydrogenase family)